MEGDQLLRATAGDGALRVFVADTTVTVRDAATRHDAWPTAAAALGRTLTAAVLLGATLKDEQSVTVRVIGDGPLGGIVAEGDASGGVRGYVKNPHVDLPLNEQGKFDVASAIGRGMFHVVRDPGFGQPYSGSVELVSGEIAEDLAAYLLRSEQIPSAVGLGVLVGRTGVIASGGYLIQALPGAPDEILSRLEENVRAVGGISRHFHEGRSPREVLDMLLAGLSPVILSEIPVRFRCRCSRERATEILSSVGPAELEDIRREEGSAELVCQFCGEKYTYTGAELQSLAARMADQGEEQNSPR